MNFKLINIARVCVYAHFDYYYFARENANNNGFIGLNIYLYLSNYKVNSINKIFD